VALLTVEKFDQSAILIHRTDTGGSTAGLTAVYKGIMKADHMEGDVTWTWPGHFKSASPSGKWTARMGAPAQNLHSNDFWTLLNTRTPSGFTPYEAIGAFFKFNNDNGDLGRYERLNNACEGHVGNGTCNRDELYELRSDLESRGLLP